MPTVHLNIGNPQAIAVQQFTLRGDHGGGTPELPEGESYDLRNEKLTIGVGGSPTSAWGAVLEFRIRIPFPPIAGGLESWRRRSRNQLKYPLNR
ncbi:MAG: hypothetical protein KGR69_02945 [Verrucomicrobia bacterium]|nr:hypothetical protein [Verrucomicrobiota bacterium]